MPRGILTAALLLVGLLAVAGPPASLALENPGAGVSKVQTGTREAKTNKAKRNRTKPGKG